MGGSKGIKSLEFLRRLGSRKAIGLEPQIEKSILGRTSQIVEKVNHIMDK